VAPTAPSGDGKAHTNAWLALERNRESLSYRLAINVRELKLLNAEARRATRASTIPKGKATARTIRTLDRRRRVLKRALRKMDASVEQVNIDALWLVVLLVTCAETYLQDLLAAAARVDPRLMSKSAQVANYADITSARSLDELAERLRQRWARGWLSDGGPKHWVSRLSRMGARGYSTGLASRLELVWGIRHITVHSAGIATADFVKRHPSAGGAIGKRVLIESERFSECFKSVNEFLEVTERFFLARFPSLHATAPKKAAK
jgi:hypothetical protein